MEKLISRCSQFHFPFYHPNHKQFRHYKRLPHQVFAWSLSENCSSLRRITRSHHWEPIMDSLQLAERILPDSNSLTPYYAAHLHILGWCCLHCTYHIINMASLAEAFRLNKTKALFFWCKLPCPLHRLLRMHLKNNIKQTNGGVWHKQNKVKYPLCRCTNL